MNEWLMTFDGHDPTDEGRRESLLTLGNGYFATRGAAPECDADDTHYPGTYVAGVYNRLGSEIAGRWVENESLVNAPNWLVLKFRIDGGEWISDRTAEVVAHRVDLDLRQGLSVRHTTFEDADGRRLQVTQRRIVSMRDHHAAALQTTFVAENFTGRLEVLSALDGTVRNRGVKRYRDLPDQHLRPLHHDVEGDDVVCLHVETTQSHIRVSQAARTRVTVGGGDGPGPREVVEHPGFVGQILDLELTEGSPVVVEKVVSLFTSRDPAIAEPGVEACDTVHQVFGDFEELLERHVVAWRHLWERAHIELGTDGDIARMVHLHKFHAM